MMEAKGEEKITFLGARQVRTYKVWVLMLMVLMGAVFVFGIIQLFMGLRVFATIPFAVIVFLQLQNIYRGIKPVGFDRSFLYVSEKGYEVVVPLENVGKIEIKNLGGIYKVVLLEKIQSGYYIFFKPSLIYPLDFNKQDERVNILRAYIRKAKLRGGDALVKNALHS